MYVYTKNMYLSSAEMWIDESIPVDQIFLFYQEIQKNQKDLEIINEEEKKELAEIKRRQMEGS